MAPLPKVESQGRMQPQRLVSDVLLEIMSWLAFYDWLDLTSDDAEISKATIEKNERRPGYSLIRASHVCKYWETVARSNRSLWPYIPLRETANRPANLIDREFGFRVQRSIGLSTPLHVSYTEFPEHETRENKSLLLKAARHLSPESPLHDSPISDWSFTAFRLWPLVRDCIKRSKVLILRAKGESISNLFGYVDEASPYGHGSFQGRVMMGPYRPVHGSDDSIQNNTMEKLGKVKMVTKIDELKDLEELVVDLDDLGFCFAFPLAPNLRSLKVGRRMSRPHVLLPFSATAIASSLIPSRLTASIVGEVQDSHYPKLEELDISVPYINYYSLHLFLFDHSNTLVSLVLSTLADVLCLYEVPTRSIVFPCLKSLSVSRLTTLIQAHLEVWHCPVLESLEIHIQARLPIITSLKTTNYPNLKMLVFGYPQSGRASPCGEDDDAELGGHEHELDLHEQRAASRLLISTLHQLDRLESLVVENWLFGCVWEEEDWIESITPRRISPPRQVLQVTEESPVNIGALSSVRNRVRNTFMWQRISAEGHLLDIDGKPLELWSDDDLSDELDPEEGEEIERRWREVVEGKVKDVEGVADVNGDYKDGDVWARMGVPTDFKADSARGPKVEDEEKPDVKETVDEKGLEDPDTDEGDWDLNSFICRSLRHITFRNCVGLEKTSLFPCIKGRTTLFISDPPLPPIASKKVTEKDIVYPTPTYDEAEYEAGVEEPPLSQSTISTLSRSSSRTSAAHSSNPSSPRLSTEALTPTPIPRPLPPAQLSKPAHNTASKASKPISTPLPLTVTEPPCPSLGITLKNCSLSQPEFDDLYAKYETKDYKVPKAQKPREPTPIPPDQRVLWI